MSKRVGTANQIAFGSPGPEFRPESGASAGAGQAAVPLAGPAPTCSPRLVIRGETFSDLWSSSRINGNAASSPNFVRSVAPTLWRMAA